MSKNILRFNASNFQSICDKLASSDSQLAGVISQYGYPPMWHRPPGFETLLHIILEQQVSLASALAALNKLREKVVRITPQNILLLTDKELKSCYFSRQKISYARHLSTSVLSKQLVLEELDNLPDEQVRIELKKIKGIGDWSAEVYMMMAMRRADHFPIGDIALINSIKAVKDLPAETSREEIIHLAAKWTPYRTVAAFILWHAYLSKRKKIGPTVTG